MNRPADDLLDPAFLVRVRRLALRVRRVLRAERHGEHRARRAGSGLTFAGHRGYVHGDDLRHLDWSLLGRLDRPFMKQFEHESELTVHLLLDASRSMDFGSPTKFVAAARFAAALSYITLAALDRVVVGVLQDGGLRLHGPYRGRSGFFSIVRCLAAAEPRGRLSIEAGLRLHAAAASPGLTVLFSDFLDPALPDALRGHFFRRHELALVQILSPQEIDPDLEGNLALVDSEDGGRTEVSIGPREIAEYRARVEAHRRSLERFARRHRGVMCRLDTDTSVERAVWDHLLRATLVERR